MAAAEARRALVFQQLERLRAGALSRVVSTTKGIEAPHAITLTNDKLVKTSGKPRECTGQYRPQNYRGPRAVGTKCATTHGLPASALADRLGLRHCRRS
jgi:hypothetical protein